jgi:phospholipid/cholesterol/gamma-HCH transport system substrate-binding protein
VRKPRFTAARIAAIAALAIAVVLIAVIVLGGGGGNKYVIELENAGQLVKGNQVLIGGQPVGSITSVKLTDNQQAEIEIKTDRTLHEGTTAVVRATSLSGVANRYISLTPGPNNLPELGDDATITADKTTSPVDLDQLFNTFDDQTRKALQDVIQGSAISYAGRGQEANDSYKYFSPALVATDKLLQELDRDEQNLSDFLVSSSRVVTAVAERRSDLASLVPNANQALGAIADQNRSLDQALVNLPPTLRQANTTFFNLRDALDDLDPLVATSKPATKDLAPFLKSLQPVAKKSVPAFRDLADTVNLKGDNNDLTDAVTDLPQVQTKLAAATGPTITAMQDSEPVLQFARPYMPDLLGAISKLGQVTAFYDADGHYARIEPAELNLFCYAGGGGSAAPQCAGAGNVLKPIPAAEQFVDLIFGQFQRCPGGSTQPNAGYPVPTDHPFLDGGQLASPADCNVTQVPPGP